MPYIFSVINGVLGTKVWTTDPPQLGYENFYSKAFRYSTVFASFYGELKVNGRVKGLGFYLFFFLFGCRTTGLFFKANDESGKDPGSHPYQENPVILLSLGYPFKNQMTKTGLNQTLVI